TPNTYQRPHSLNAHSHIPFHPFSAEILNDLFRYHSKARPCRWVFTLTQFKQSESSNSRLNASETICDHPNKMFARHEITLYTTSEGFTARARDHAQRAIHVMLDQCRKQFHSLSRRLFSPICDFETPPLLLHRDCLLS